MNELALIFAEKQLIAYLLAHPHLLDKTKASLFCTETGKTLVASLKSLQEDGVALTTDNTLTHLSSQGISISRETIDALFHIKVPEADFNFLKSAVERAGVQIELQTQILPDLINIVSTKNTFNADDVRDVIRRTNRLIGKDIDQSHVYTGEEASGRYEDVLNHRRSGDCFYSSGDAYLDSKLMIGFAPGTQSVIFGTTGSGKTNFALSLFLKMIHRKIPCVYISLEMPLDMLLDRLFAMKYQVPLNWLYPQANEFNTVPDWVFEKLELFKLEMANAKHFRIIDEASLGVDDVEVLISDIKKEMNVEYLNVFIDLTTMLDEFSATGNGSRADMIELGVNRLNAIAKKSNSHIINVVQSNRSQDNVRLKKFEDIMTLYPTLNHIKSSNAIAERARLVMGIFRPKYYADRYFPDEVQTETMDDVMHVSILKQSQGALGELTYLFAGEMASLYKFNQAARPVRVPNGNQEDDDAEEESH